MSLSLPGPISAYFRADAVDGDAVARCFTADAIVIDEKKIHQGRQAIARWKADASDRYGYVAEPFSIEGDRDNRIVIARLTGNFPGSPVDLRYAFTLVDGAISRLEIAA